MLGSITQYMDSVIRARDFIGSACVSLVGQIPVVSFETQAESSMAGDIHPGNLANCPNTD